ncbi:2-oxoacid:acceptor oxidoreductase family protein [Archaeoglobus veneficus]|uniref:Pyruvate ferredoxin oxidoreductase subunit gamma/delta n=1 Tax=Archaeoglobus veneficus (strain DSM 11195 / SNP6) TaxID=693661 RepID=F2KRX7_ARCVS|nr:2-oxoacid:acceptor oxidoreductase family protein [Archaeoglobus veneficus]AEA46818.1 pyruvate ferredoxin oxidoreductase subunit gamma/delta [Archaeoglobus veneficus SNP6]
MIEVGFYGSGDPRAIEILSAAALREGKFCQGFVSDNLSFCRIDRRPIRVRSINCKPDIAILQDETYMYSTDVEDAGIIFVDSSSPSEDFSFADVPVKTVDATGHIFSSLQLLFSDSHNIPDCFHVRRYEDMEFVFKLLAKPFVNTVMLGAVAALGVLSIQSITDAITEKYNDIAEGVAAATWRIYEEFAHKWPVEQNARALARDYRIEQVFA